MKKSTVLIAVAAGCGVGTRKKKRPFRSSDPFRHLSLQVEAPRDITR